MTIDDCHFCLRIVSLAENAIRPLQVTFRRRLYTSAVRAIAFSPNGQWLVTASREENYICFVLIQDQGSALILGHVSREDMRGGYVFDMFANPVSLSPYLKLLRHAYKLVKLRPLSI